ncbi:MULTISPECIES: S8 family serine peptidase [unclassified Frondihabitans]|uniref:S8 family peptidase n=1 Tax=unclassified Frondihabitans TaxID=2626248 RepID=UPI000FA0990E|nr:MULTISPECIES: S8 family serine peptidase [unclassified Frondihabitans]RPE77983.1 PA domain-containing protein [Frondihabitans sp. PhB153]RPF08263.1 PA domain-containing protein [Frondihabitans sp. PhB161]
MRPSRRSVGTLCVVAAATIALVSTPLTVASAAPANPLGSASKTADLLKLSSPLREAKGSVAAFIRVSGTGALSVDASAKGGKLTGRPQSTAAKNRVSAIRQNAAAVTKALAAQGPKVTTLYTTEYTVPGVAVIADAGSLATIAARSDVVSITPIAPKSIPTPVATKGEASPLNSTSDVYTRAVQAWQQTGHTGTGVNIAVIDTGLDYTHADFGGPGTTAAYDEALSSTGAPDPALFDSAKFLGGTDFAGPTYDADPSSQAYDPVPNPDANPIDGRGGGHGSHVAGTAAGFGLDSDKKTFTGDYTKLTEDEVKTMSIGPGTAPDAGLYSLKVFGDGGGSTDLTGAALDWVGQALTEGKDINVINLSLGSDYSNPDDPDNAKIDSLVARGVLPVIASGNAGDFTDIGGSPGDAENALTVAAATTGAAVFDGVDVTAPSSVAGTIRAQYSISYTKPLALTDGVVTLPSAANAAGCDPYTAADAAKVKGKVVLLKWTDTALECGSVKRFDNATAAGAIGVLLGGSVNVFDAGISGNAVIPGAEITKDAYAKLLPAVTAAEAGGTPVTVSFKDSLRLFDQAIDSTLTDTLATFSSRGVHGSYSNIIKPDVAAPGVNVVSVRSGTGTDREAESGTSMATPDTAGIAALTFEAHDGWSALQVKQAVMNTATHDLKNAAGTLYSTLSQGTGRIDALQAVTNQVTVTSTQNAGLVSASFGVVPVSAAKTATRTLTLHNSGNASQTFTTSYSSRITQPGVSFTLSAPKVVVPARGDATLTLTMKIDPSKLRKVIDPTQDATTNVSGVDFVREFVAAASGYVKFDSADRTKSGLRLSVFAAPKPVSANTATSPVFAKSTSTQATLKISGTTLNQGTGSQAYLGLAAPFVLGANSAKLTFPTGSPKQSLAGADILAVGASSNAPNLTDKNKGIVSFGIKTAGPIANPGLDGAPEVFIDTNRDGTDDFVSYVTKSASVDATFVATDNLSTNKTVDLQPYNANYLDKDVNTFDSSVAVLPVSLAALGYTTKSKSTAFNYHVATFSNYAPGLAETDSTVVDSTHSASFDALKPSLWFSQKKADDLGGVLLRDQSPGIAVHRTKASTKQILLLHLHNAVAKQAQTVTVTTKKK